MKSAHTHADQRYIEGLRRNDTQVVREIYERFSNEAIRWVQNNNGSADDARDVFQEALIVLFEKAQNPDFVLTCPIGAMLYVLYSRKWYDRLQAKKRDGEVRFQEEIRYTQEFTSDTLLEAEQMEEETRDRQRLAAAFEQLSDLCRQMLRLLSEGISPRETAERLALNSTETLYRRKNACVQRWRTLYLSA
jgi:RNA polymerase sigma factor (sigma-70 family)